MTVLVYEWDHHRQRYVTPGDRVECLKERVVAADDYVAEVERLRAVLYRIADPLTIWPVATDRSNPWQEAARAALRPVTSPRTGQCQHEWTDVARCLACGLTYDMYDPATEAVPKSGPGHD